ncbi:MAG: hypothetical protein QOE05_1406 [Actinomycetota bacterium]|jgi:hypothetical protein|nr:hypothetical protein [Actinomycetota bacterium]
MSTDELDLIERLHAVARELEMPPAPLADDLRRGRRRVRRNRAAVAAAALVGVLGATAALAWPHRAQPDSLVPVDRPGVVVGDVPVWYDAKGLHRGDVVEQTAVEILQPERLVGPDQVDGAKGALALVRSGALYLDPATGDVWFHPWGGKPRVIGHNSAAGPGGDPQGDTAAWFETNELVVYDTAAGREITRTPGVAGAWAKTGDHYPTNNGFLAVSAESVTWHGEYGAYRHDVRTGRTSAVENPAGRGLIDVQGDVEVFRDSGVVLAVRGKADKHIPDLETHLLLSTTGNFVLGVKGTQAPAFHGAAFVDTRTGELWPVMNGYPWIAWSYGDLAMIDIEGHGLQACNAARRTCAPVHPVGPYLLPTN